MKLAWRSPRFFLYGGIYLQLWGKWYLIVPWKDKTR